MSTRAKDLIYSFIQSIDLFNFLLKNHHRRVAIISWHIGRKMKLSTEQLNRVVLAASLHDIGALKISERDKLIQIDIENPHPHARLGSYMLESFDPFKPLARIIFYHHWAYSDDGRFHKEIGPVPIEAYVLHLADRVDIAIDQSKPVLLQTMKVREEITKRSKDLFHPEVYKAFMEASKPDRFWLDIDNTSMREVLEKLDPELLSFEMNTSVLSQLAFTISKIIDCRSEFTSAHSYGVSQVAFKIAQLSGKDESTCEKIQIAGLLHDIGKIGISTEILEKEGPLTTEEQKHIQEHAYYTNKILFMPKELNEIAEWASHHHENHQGKGYPDNYTKGEITIEMDILSYADVFTALAERRPYRKGLSLDKIIEVLRREFVYKHGCTVFDLIVEHQDEIYNTCISALKTGHERYDKYVKLADKFEDESR
ncbi:MULTISPECIES: HD-GYP domain-containing protein [unclassified Fusibacter]|uniref:HD-GYP domain-containing protein n=1 Tax=unclassified Fusibacter TaxID=2624464 RepID=UPI001013C070|nr:MULTISPECIES: HD domain-containing phosphohydrolase [unclassified Fusibacter]MCK8060621.1 HD domain-containing protein [Fusibacter sp. A2]NPE22925.1 HD domain-containing protein [Fusibacter sp. A1]RXV59992.1 HD domain-containing protein [Fusibacter sp. A1]